MGAETSRQRRTHVLLTALSLAAWFFASPAAAGAVKAEPARGRGSEREIGEASTALRAGRWEEAEALLRRLRLMRGAKPALTVQHAEALVALGREDDARHELEGIYRDDPANLAVAGALLHLSRRDGEEDKESPARVLREDLRQVWRSGRWSPARADDVLTLVELARQENRWSDANRLLREGARAFPHDPRPNRVWGELLLEKHAAADAETSFKAALTIDPHDAEARVGLARAVLDLRYDVTRAREHLARALAENPRLPSALFLQGELALDAEDLAAVDEVAMRLRTTNLRSWQAVALLASRALLRGDRALYDSERGRMDGRREVGHFYAFVAEALGRQRRYDASAQVAADCRAQAPHYAPCLAALGTAALRLGDEERGLEALRAAFSVDAFDERVFNQLQLFEKTIPARYEMIERGPFRFRVPKGQRAPLEAHIAPFLEEVYRAYRVRYAYEPKLPITVELYADHASYAIRVVGLPDLSVSAVCFGRVIATEMPPSPGSNWGLVLSHELAHVFALGLSESRVPRWFTEGLSEVESARLRPEWTRQQGRLLWSALARGAVPSLAALSHAFLRATSPDEALLAYALSARAVSFLEARAGFSRLRAALVSFADGVPEPEVLARIAGTSLEALDAAFVAQLTADVARFRGQYLPLESRFVTSPAVAGDAMALLGEGLRALEAGDRNKVRQVEELLEQAAVGEARRAFFFLRASRLLMEGDPAGAYRELASRLSSDEEGPALEGYDVRRLLAEAALRAGRAEAAELHIRRAIELDPLRVEPRRFLTKLVTDIDPRALPVRIDALSGLLKLDAVDASRAKRLLEDCARAGDQRGVIEAEPFARFTDPTDATTPLRLGRAEEALGHRQEAEAAFSRALLLVGDPTLRSEITAALRAARAAPGLAH